MSIISLHFLSLIISIVLISFAVGSNSTSNAVGISIGCQIISLRKAIIFFALFVFLGLFFQGSHVMETVGKNLVKLTIDDITVSMLIAAVLIIVSNIRRIPLSTHQVIIGSLTGVGVASGIRINWGLLLKIFISWVVSPFLAFLLAIAFYKVIEFITSKVTILFLDKFIKYLLILGILFIAYNTGANELATVLGPFACTNLVSNHILWLQLLGTLSLFLGAILLGPKVIYTVGKGITSLDPYSGIAAQLGASVSVLIFTFFAMPVSTTYCIIGGISGVGALKGMETVGRKTLINILIVWWLAPLLAFLVAYLIKISFQR